MHSSDWLPTACILCECNCGIVASRRRRLARSIRGDKMSGSAGYTATRRCGWTISGTTGSLAQLADAPPSRWHLRGDRLDTAIVETPRDSTSVIPTAGTRSSLRRRRTGRYPAAPGQAPSEGTGVAPSVECALAQGEVPAKPGPTSSRTAGHTRGEFENAEVSVFVGKNLWMSQLPGGPGSPNEMLGDPGRSMIDQSRRHRTPRRWPTSIYGCNRVGYACA